MAAEAGAATARLRATISEIESFIIVAGSNELVQMRYVGYYSRRSK
jgi:hypothetical protein